MEIADIFVINKADREGADRVEKEIRAMQSLASRHGDWIPPIVKTVASSGQGIAEVAAAIESYEAYLDKSDVGRKRRVENWRNRLVAMLRDEVLARVTREHMDEESATRYAAEVADHKRDPYSLVDEIVARLGK
jgi:LAO/AO transport system kinase